MQRQCTFVAELPAGDWSMAVIEHRDHDRGYCTITLVDRSGQHRPYVITTDARSGRVTVAALEPA